jgi:hypothetical protein
MSDEQGPMWEYKLDEYGIVLEIWGGDEVRKVGPRLQVCEAMRRFLASLDGSKER